MSCDPTQPDKMKTALQAPSAAEPSQGGKDTKKAVPIPKVIHVQTTAENPKELHLEGASQKGEDTDALMEDKVVNGKEKVEEESDYNAFYDTPLAAQLRGDDTYKSIFENVWKGSKRFRMTFQRASNISQHTIEGLKSVFTQGLQATLISPFMNDVDSIINPLLVEISRVFRDNTYRRWALLQRLEDYDRKWQSDRDRFQALLNGIPIEELPDAPPSPRTRNSPEHEQKEMLYGEANEHDSKQGPFSPDPTATTEDEVFPLEELLDQADSATAERIQRFMTSRDRLEEAYKKLRATLKTIEKEMENTTETVLQIVRESVLPFHQALDHQECKLLDEIGHNYNRKLEYRATVEETRKRTEELLEEERQRKRKKFAQLLSEI